MNTTQSILASLSGHIYTIWFWRGALNFGERQFFMLYVKHLTVDAKYLIVDVNFLTFVCNWKSVIKMKILITFFAKLKSSTKSSNVM